MAAVSKFSWNLKNTRFYHNFNVVKAVWINEKALYKQLYLPDHDEILRFDQNSFPQNSSFLSWVNTAKKSWENLRRRQNSVLSRLTPNYQQFVFIVYCLKLFDSQNIKTLILLNFCSCFCLTFQKRKQILERNKNFKYRNL